MVPSLQFPKDLHLTDIVKGPLCQLARVELHLLWKQTHEAQNPKYSCTDKLCQRFPFKIIFPAINSVLKVGESFFLLLTVQNRK
jgi:hypothetical protein